ncbi:MULTISPECIES: class I SAM-dependent methyltransferase [Chitinophagaceae]
MEDAKLNDSTWGKNLKDWIEIQEKQGLKGYEYILDFIGNKSLDVLDIGCGTGSFCEVAAKRNMQVVGMDVSAAFIEEAKMRVPAGTFVVGRMEKLPFDRETFDIVCGFNSFQYADNLEDALNEAKRVLTINGQLLILIWDKKSTCEIAAFLKKVKEALLPTPQESRNPFALSEDDTLEKTMASLAFTDILSESIASTWYYPDRETALKGLLSLGALAHTIEHNGIENVKNAILSSIAPYIQPNESIVFKNQYKIVRGYKIQ